MKKLSKIEIKKTGEFFKKLPRTAAEHFFATFLILVFISLIFGGLMFYQYSILAQKAEPKVEGAEFQFEESLYQKILEVWENRGERFEEAGVKEYPDPFR